MSSTILTNWTVYYADDAAAGAGMKQIKWTGTTGTTSVNALYSALMDLFDNAAQNNYFDSIPVKALTPTLYEIGSIDAGDRQPWFIDPNSVTHLTGGGLNTVKWTRDLTDRTASHGIYKLTRTTSNLTANDVGRTYTTSGTATGWILHVSGSHIWVRPTDGTATHDMSGITSITANSVSDTITSGSTVTDETIWSNIYTLGTLQANTNIYIYQNGSLIPKWWPAGHIDILIPTTDFGILIDSGNLTIFARQYTKLYDHYITDVATGGRTPIPIATSSDTNNPTGAYAFDFDAGSGTIAVGEVITSGTKKGIVTSITQANPIGRIEYYLLDPYTQFADNDAFTTAGGGGTVNEPTAIETLVAGYTDITLTFGSISRDLNNGQGSQPYDVEINCNNRRLSQVYEYLKFLTRSDSITSLNGIAGQAYLAANASYDPVKVAPFGTFAGGKFFGARGVWLTNVPAADGNNYELTDANGVRRIPPTTIAITINGVNSGDKVTVFRTTGNNETIDREIYTSIATGNNSGDPDFVVQEPIAADTPTSGYLRVVNNTINDEDIYPYSGWSGSTFTLDSVTLVDTYTAADTAYVPYIQTTASSTSVSKSVTYVQDRYILVIVRAAGTVPFKVPSQVTSDGVTVTAVRTTDSIYTP